jgi:hypothetical protein
VVSFVLCSIRPPSCGAMHISTRDGGNHRIELLTPAELCNPFFLPLPLATSMNTRRRCGECLYNLLCCLARHERLTAKVEFRSSRGMLNREAQPFNRIKAEDRSGGRWDIQIRYWFHMSCPFSKTVMNDADKSESRGAGAVNSVVLQGSAPMGYRSIRCMSLLRAYFWFKYSSSKWLAF